jgi:hypothetical protein
LSFAVTPVAATVTPGWIETWTGTSTNGWSSGGEESNPGSGGVQGGYLKVQRTEAGNLGAHCTCVEYQGDWRAAGIAQVKLWLNELTIDEGLEIHFAIGNTSNMWQYNTGFNPAANSWQEFVVDLSSAANFTQIRGSGTPANTFEAALQSVDRILIRNDAPPPGLPDPENVVGDFAIDNLGLLGSTDTDSPIVQVNTPNGGQSWVGGSIHNITWSATDLFGVVARDVFYRDSDTGPWVPIARNLTTNIFSWAVHNTPTSTARVRVVARDAANNMGEDQSDNVFTITAQAGGRVATTLRDFFQPGTQPLGAGTLGASADCIVCHGGYNQATEPGYAFKGTMMAQAARDPLFYACLSIAEQDAPSSGDLCIRCHSPVAWLLGHSQPTSGARIDAADRDGVTCDVCHRAVDPIDQGGVSPPEDDAVLAGLLPAHVPSSYSNGQYVVDPDPRKRGPFSDAFGGGTVAHSFLASPFHRSSNLCGTCHDVSNPVFDRVGTTSDYTLGTLNEPATMIASHALMPLERTYSEWKHSAFPAGVLAPDFAGNKPDGIVSECQDCHQADVLGRGCNPTNFPSVPNRADLPFHDFTGGNSWVPTIIGQTAFGSETDPAALSAASNRAIAMLQKAALLDVQLAPQGANWRATVTVTNRTGHKLPTGYPEGRRMWLEVVAKNHAGQEVYHSGAYNAGTGVLTLDPDIVVYEAELGRSTALGSVPAGPGFHFVLNDRVIKDNRIPPRGFTNSAYDAFGGAPVDATRPAPRYADGQYSDVTIYTLPASTARVDVNLHYQTISKDYADFLHANATNGQEVYDLWEANGRSAPVLMKSAWTAIPHSISASAGANGTISPPGTQTVLDGQTASFLMTPTPGYNLHSLVVDGGQKMVTPYYVFLNVGADHTIAANFGLGWAPGGTHISAFSPGWPKDAASVPDGAGGVIVAWRDSVGSLDRIRAQHVLASGVMDPNWPPGGILVQGVFLEMSDPVIASDGQGGAFVAWIYNEGPTIGHLFVQHVLSSGALDPRWPAAGLSTCGGSCNRQLQPSIASDGAGGTYVSWRELRGSTYGVYLVRLLESGALAPGFPATGIELCAAPSPYLQTEQRMIADGSGGAIVVWEDRRSFSSVDIHAQRVLRTGALAPGWPAGGRALCTAALDQNEPIPLSDGGGGAIVTWLDRRSADGQTHLFAQRVLGSGTVAWAADGLGIGVAAIGQMTPAVASDGAGGMFIAYRDRRPFGGSGIYGHHVLSTGTLDSRWLPTGDPIIVDPSRGEPRIVSDLAGGAIVAWTDTTSRGAFMAWRVNPAGGLHGPPWPRTLSSVLVPTNPQLVSDGAGGTIAAWHDAPQNSVQSIYAQRITTGGVLGPPPALNVIPNGALVSGASGVQQNTVIAGDRQGRAIVAWEDVGAALAARSPEASRGRANRAASTDAALVNPPRLYFARTDERGFASGSGLLSTVASAQTEAVIVHDNGGGAFFVWTDDRNGNLDLYAQHVFGPGGGTSWPAAGLPVSTGTGEQRNACAIPDGSGGLLVFYEDSRGGTFNIYGQRITEAGTAAWGASRLIAGGSGVQRNPVATPDGEGGAIVGWEDYRSGNADVFVARVTAAGTIMGAVGYGSGPGDQTEPTIAGDGAGGSFLAWQDTRHAKRRVGHLRSPHSLERAGRAGMGLRWQRPLRRERYPATSDRRRRRGRRHARGLGRRALQRSQRHRPLRAACRGGWNAGFRLGA